MKYINIILLLNTVNCIPQVVLTKNGYVKGVVQANVISFLGIPYAEVDPNNPFGHYLDPPVFEGVYLAKDDNVTCPQQNDINSKIVGILDCLRVNVYVPRESQVSNSLHSVMVFIHGGDFRKWDSNKASYGPDFLVHKGVILVTFNYRLGPYGFMSIDRRDFPGNQGLRDQLKALQWVKDNIAAFGGDEDDITVFGQGAGAVSIEFHMLSKHSKGLFHKVILQSGTVLCDWVMAKPDVDSPIKLADHLGFKTDDTDEAIRYLSELDPKSVIKASIDTGLMESFKPVIETKFKHVQAMIKSKPSNLLRELSTTLPMIIGVNSKEQHQNIRYNFKALNLTFKDKLKKYLNLEEEDLAEVVSSTRYFYLDDEEIGLNTVDKMLEFDSDFSFMYPSLRDSRYYIEAGAFVYLYVFDYAGRRNYMKNRYRLNVETGAVHGDEIGYLFQQSNYKEPITYEDRNMIELLTTMWTNFAKTSNPTSTLPPYPPPFTWRPASKVMSYALLNNGVKMVHHPFRSRMAFWDQIFEFYEDNVRW